MRVCQSMHLGLTHRHREQAPSHIGIPCISNARATRRDRIGFRVVRDL